MAVLKSMLLVQNDPIFFDIPKSFITTMSHSDSIDKLPKSNILAKTVNGTNAIFKLITKRIIRFSISSKYLIQNTSMKLRRIISIICVCKKIGELKILLKMKLRK